MRVIFFIAAVFLTAGAAAFADDDIEVKTLAGAAAPPATIDQLDWLVGHWTGEGLGGPAAEIIAPAADGQMMGMFRSQKADGALGFYEFYVFAEVGETLVLRIKHFTPAMVGWEDKEDFVEFPLVEIAENAVYFDGVTFAVTAPDVMQSAVLVSEMGVLQFHYRRTPLD